VTIVNGTIVTIVLQRYSS